MVEHESSRIHESCQKATARPQNPVALAPHRSEVRNKNVRSRMKNQIESSVAERAQICHVTPYAAKLQALPRCDQLIFGQLFVGQIEACYLCARPRQDGRLLAAAGRQT